MNPGAFKRCFSNVLRGKLPVSALSSFFQHGMNPDTLWVVDDPNTDGERLVFTLLTRACSSNRIDVVRALLDANADPNLPDLDQNWPVFCAIHADNLAMIRLLLEHGAMFGSHDVLHFLGNHSFDERQLFYLFDILIEFHQLDNIIRFPLEIEGYNDPTVFHLMVMDRSFFECIVFFANMDKFDPEWNQVDKEGNTILHALFDPLFRARHWREARIDERLLEWDCQLVEWIIDHCGGMDMIALQNSDGQTPLDRWIELNQDASHITQLLTSPVLKTDLPLPKMHACSILRANQMSHMLRYLA
jgi:ankyrin repeat protein